MKLNNEGRPARGQEGQGQGEAQHQQGGMHVAARMNRIRRVRARRSSSFSPSALLQPLMGLKWVLVLLLLQGLGFRIESPARGWMATVEARVQAQCNCGTEEGCAQCSSFGQVVRAMAAKDQDIATQTHGCAKLALRGTALPTA
eukprot:COSAG02_NODE_29685_length_565_cov_0.665236_1_plen_143_part_10